jgi:hypothetical protein
MGFYLAYCFNYYFTLGADPMNISTVVIIALILLAFTSIWLLVNRNWRLSIFALALQYIGVFILVLQVWPFGLAAVKLVAGWMACAILTASHGGSGLIEPVFPGRIGNVFRLILGVVVIIISIAVTSQINLIIPVDTPFLGAGLLLIGMGIVQLGIANRPLRIILGLLTALSGFEIIYANLEYSLLVAGLLALVTLGLALAASYMILSPTMEDVE